MLLRLRPLASWVAAGKSAGGLAGKLAPASQSATLICRRVVFHIPTHVFVFGKIGMSTWFSTFEAGLARVNPVHNTGVATAAARLRADGHAPGDALLTKSSKSTRLYCELVSYYLHGYMNVPRHAWIYGHTTRTSIMDTQPYTAVRLVQLYNGHSRSAMNAGMLSTYS
jgi:hypothetical protein